MRKKLILIQNGLKDLRGHYFETSVAIAGAAREAGLQPILATHVTCPTHLFPPWLEVYPVCRTDHWMGDPPAAAACLDILNLDPYGVEPVDLAAVRDGRASFREFLTSRFTPTSCPPDRIALPPGPAPTKDQARGRPFIRAAVKAAAYYLLPPVVYEQLPRCLPRCVHPAVIRQMSTRMRRKVPPHPRPESDSTVISASLCQSTERPFILETLGHLMPSYGYILEHALLFKHDVERLLALTGFGPTDHVVLGTAHGRELLAIYLILRRLGERLAPTFHLEFRHGLYQGLPNYAEWDHAPAIWQHRLFLTLYANWGSSAKIRLYSDTPELSQEYASLADLDWGVLPIPFRTHFLTNGAEPVRPPLNLVFLGDARDEKGFHWLPSLVESLRSGYLENGKVRFLLQATKADPGHSPASVAAREKLAQYPREQVELLAVETPLSAEEYYRLVSAADLVLLPYDRNRYRSSSSGTFAEAVAAGKPTVVPAQTWMARCLKSGETFVDPESFRRGVCRILDDYDSYRQRAEANRSAWLAEHAPARLVEALVA